MHFSAAWSCAALAALLPAVSATPIEARQELSTFRLKTKVVPGISDCGTNKSDLYIYSYHTGAGLGAATAGAGLTGSSNNWFFLNNTDLMWTYVNNTIGAWPTSIQFSAYTSFNPVSISIAGPNATSGFFTNSTGLYTNSTQGGWLVCDWWYGAPQLFADTGYARGPYPSSCSKVELTPEPYTPPSA